MILRTHLALALLISLLWIKYIGTLHTIIFTIIVILISIIPDIDSTKSYIGRRNKIFSIPIKLIFGHRKFVHSIFPPLIISAILYYFNIRFIAIPIFIGYITHLLGDALTKEGINFLYPLSTFKIQGFFRTGSFTETLVFIFLIILNIILLLKIF